VLALDQGSHATRAFVFDADGRPIADHDVAIGTTQRGDVEFEQDPEEILASVQACIEVVVRALGPRAQFLQAAGLATQRSSIVCWDRETGQPVSPVLSWQDRRASQYLGPLAAEDAEVTQRTGLRLSPHYGASKLRWCLDHLPAVREALARDRLCLGPLAGFLVFRLMRERPFVVDPANAARTLLWNTKTGNWDDWLIERFGVPRKTLPESVATVRHFGELAVGDRLVPLTCLTGDQSAALFAFGTPQADTLYCNLGTGAFIQALLPPDANTPAGLLCSIAFDDGSKRLSVMEGTVNGAGAALDWARKALGLKAHPDDVEEALAETPDMVLFINAIGGLGAPYWQPQRQSHFAGEGTARQKLAAVAESIVFLLAVIVERMQEVPVTFSRILVTGGVSVVDSLCQRLADVTGLVVERPAEREATARGVAFLAAGQPVRFNHTGSCDRFQPRHQPELISRYQRWRRQMDEDDTTGPP